MDIEMPELNGFEVIEKIDKIVKKFKLPPSGIHEEISPRYRGVLENGDTVPVGESTRVGDTVSYIYYKMK